MYICLSGIMKSIYRNRHYFIILIVKFHNYLLIATKNKALNMNPTLNRNLF